MKTLQIEAGGGWDQTPTNNEILAAGGINAPNSGDWYTVKFNGVNLDRSTIVSATRNAAGEIITHDPNNQ